MTFKLSGVITATITPFKNGKVYEKGVIQVTDFLCSRGVSALFECGTTGEGMIMNLQERKRVAEIAVERSSVPVIIHCGTNNLEDTIELCKHAKDIGAAGTASITPMFYAFTNEGYVDYYNRISRSCDIPQFLYNNPARAGAKLAPDVVGRIFNEASDSLVGVKESSGDLTYLGRIIQQVPGKFVFNGADACMLPALVLGTSGQVSGYSNPTPELYVELYKAWLRGDIQGGRKIQTRISILRASLETPHFQPMKEALKLRGIDAGDVKPPLMKMGEKEVEALRNKLIELEPELFLQEKKVANV